MSLLVVGSVALDSIFTPFGETADALGGSAVYFSVAGSLLHPVQVVGVVGERLSGGRARAARRRGASTGRGVERAEGESFRWKGKYSYDLQSRETLETRLGVFADFQPKLPDGVPARPSSSSSATSIPSSSSACSTRCAQPKLVVCDTMNYWIQSKKAALLELLGAGRHADGERQRGPRAERATGTSIGPAAGSWRTAPSAW